jgi:hypothetical protein
MPLDNASRQLTPADLRVLEPDLLGVIAMVLHGREAPEAESPSEWPRRPARQLSEAARRDERR